MCCDQQAIILAKSDVKGFEKVAINESWNRDRHTIRLLLSICPVGGTLGFIAVLMSYMARTRPWEQPAHPPLASSIMLGIPGFMAGVLVSAIIARFESAEWIRPRAFRIWCLWGLAYGISLPLMTGALMPIFDPIIRLIFGAIGFMDFLSDMLDSIFRMPWTIFIQGTIGLPSGLLMGIIFAIGSWLLDVLNSIYGEKSRAISPYFVSILFSLIILSTYYLIPVKWILRLGWGSG